MTRELGLEDCLLLSPPLQITPACHFRRPLGDYAGTGGPQLYGLTPACDFRRALEDYVGTGGPPGLPLGYAKAMLDGTRSEGLRLSTQLYLKELLPRVPNSSPSYT